MLGCNLELSADMEFAKLAEKFIVLVGDKIIIPYAAADKYLFYSADLPQLAQKLKIIAVVNLGVRADTGIKTLAVAAGAFCQLLLTGRLSEIGSRPSDIVNISLKIGVINKLFRFRQNRRVTARLNHPALMKCQRAEGTAAEATAR